MKTETYEDAIDVLVNMAKEIEDKFDGINTFPMSEACYMSDQIDNYRRAASFLIDKKGK